MFNEGVMRVTHINSVRTSDETFDFEKNKISWVTRGIIFEAIKFGNSNNMKLLDLGVVNFDDITKSGVTKFKLSLCKNVVDTFIYRKTSATAEGVKKKIYLIMASTFTNARY